MTMLLGFLAVLAASIIAIILNDRFELGGYITDDDLSATPTQSEVKEPSNELTTAGK